MSSVWEDFLQYAESREDVLKERKRARVQAALEGHSDDAVVAEVMRRRSGFLPPQRSIKQVEIETHLRRALELGRLCSNDPVCAQHRSDSREEQRFLHGAACHGCLLIAETSCERRNEFLDRALVVATVDGGGAEFFQGNHL